MSIILFDTTVQTLAKSLDMRSKKQVLIASNIANAETPGYQAQTLDFEGALARALTLDDRGSDSGNSLRGSGDSAISNVTGEIYNQTNNVVREDGNTVDRDAEMMSLAENQLLFDAAADLVKKKLAMLKYSIADGGSH